MFRGSIGGVGEGESGRSVERVCCVDMDPDRAEMQRIVQKCSASSSMCKNPLKNREHRLRILRNRLVTREVFIILKKPYLVLTVKWKEFSILPTFPPKMLGGFP